MASYVKQTASEIRQEVYAADSKLGSYISQTATSITQAVYNSESKMASYVKQTASEIRQEVYAADSKLGSYISQTATSITQAVYNSESGWKSAIKQQADRISLVVEGTGANASIKPASIVASINNAGSNIKISADHIVLDGEVVAESLRGRDVSIEGLTAESINVDSIDVYALYGYQWYITDENGNYLNKKVTDAISSIGKNLNPPSGQIGINFTRLDGRTGTVNFNIADTQTYIDGVSAARNSVTSGIVDGNNNAVSGQRTLSAGSSLTLYPAKYVSGTFDSKNTNAAVVITAQSQSQPTPCVVTLKDGSSTEYWRYDTYNIYPGDTIVFYGAIWNGSSWVRNTSDPLTIYGNGGGGGSSPSVSNVYRKQGTNNIGIVFSDGSKIQRTASEIPDGAWTNYGFS